MINWIYRINRDMEHHHLLSGIYLTLLLFIAPNSAQDVPYVSCPDIFEYLGYNQEYVGRISVQHDPQYQENTLRVELSQRGTLESNYVGRLTLWDDDQTTQNNIRNGLPIQYRVDFPTPGKLPKVTLISINGNMICRDQPYLPSAGLASVTLRLSHSLRSSTTPLFSQGPQQTQFFQPTRRQRPQRPQSQQRPQSAQPPQRPQPPVWQQTYVEPEFEDRKEVQNFPPIFVNTTPPAPAPTPRATRPSRPTAAPRTGGQGLLQLSGICGRVGAITSPLIVHGTQVAPGQLPWMVALYERVANGVKFFCGGTLVSAATVLTAAHCFRFGSRNLPASRAAVSLGRNTLDLVSAGELRDVSLVLIHEQYTVENYTDADIALLRLASPVSFGEFIKPICLWNENYLLQLPSGHKSFVAGWGEDEHGNANTRVAKMTDTDIVLESDCLRNLKNSKSASFVTSHTLCASNKQGAGPCHGDSGGGLMLEELDVWLLRGVVSAGQILANRCDLTQPVIYTDLAKHIEWLRQNIWT